MAETTYFPRRLILAGAIVSGVLLALAVHMLGARYGLDLGGLWRSDTSDFMPAGAAIGWWLIATVGFSGGYFTANLMHSAASGQIPQRMRQFLIAVGVLVLRTCQVLLRHRSLMVRSAKRVSNHEATAGPASFETRRRRRSSG